MLQGAPRCSIQVLSRVLSRHCNFSRETRKREICWREISHGKIRREKREIVKSKIRVFWPKLKRKYKKTHLILFCFSFQMCIPIYSLTVESNLWWSGSPPSETWVRTPGHEPEDYSHTRSTKYKTIDFLHWGLFLLKKVHLVVQTDTERNELHMHVRTKKMHHDMLLKIVLLCAEKRNCQYSFILLSKWNFFPVF